MPASAISAATVRASTAMRLARSIEITAYRFCDHRGPFCNIRPPHPVEVDR
jgi:hypothetical protein